MKLSEKLLQKAAYFRSLDPNLVAVDMLKQAGMSEEDAVLEIAQQEMQKAATSGLVEKGIDYDRALEMVKSADIHVRDLPGYQREKSVEELAWEELTKMASEVQELEAKAAERDAAMEKAAELQVQLELRPEVTGGDEVLEKLASTQAFTHEDLEALRKLPAETMTKVASLNEPAWSMGRPAGMAAEAVDPILQFVLGDR